MRYATVLFFLVLTTGCRNEIETRDVNFLTHNQLENNVREISHIQKELKDFKIDDVKANMKMVKKLLQTHKELKSVYDSMDRARHFDASILAANFIQRHFNDVYRHSKFDYLFKANTPPSLTKFYLATVEAHSIVAARNSYVWHDEDAIKIEKWSLMIIPSAPVFREGEPITGELKIMADLNFESVKKLYKKMTLNGMEVKAGPDGWKFKLTPKVSSTGLIPYELVGKGFIKDTTANEGNTVVYVQKR